MIFSDFLKTHFPNAKKNGSGYQAQCPSHDDRQASLSLSEANDGGVVLHCHAGCETQAVVTALGLTMGDLFATPRSKLSTAPKAKAAVKQAASLPPWQRIETTYDYFDISGDLLFQSVRLHSPKGFIQRRPNSSKLGAWLWNMDDITPVLYLLPQLIAASCDDLVFVCEGEKDADRLSKAGLIATTNPMGAGKWCAEYTEILRGRHVVILQDNDDAGRRHCQEVAQSLFGVAASAKVLSLPDLPVKGDVSDFLDSLIASDISEEEAIGRLRELALNASEWQSPTASSIPMGEIKNNEEEAGTSKLKDGYQAYKGALVLVKSSGHEISQLANFEARIVSDVTEDDGADRRRVFEIEARLNGSTANGEVTAEEFVSMNWVVKTLGAKAIIYPNRKDHARTAIQVISDGIKSRTVFAHTGWREIDGEWWYLHGGGAISADGQKDCAVRLPAALKPFVLPEPPRGDALKSVIRAELELLDLVPDEAGIPVLSAPFGAVLGSADYSHHVEGGTGAGKSMLLIIVQQHCGPGFDKKHIPADWEWTALSLKELAFVAKDAVLLIDEFKPKGTSHDISRWHQRADDVLRGAANHSGRGKLNRDSTMRNARAPRGLIVSTGEDVPKGESLRARLAITQFEKTTMNWERLTVCQQRAAEGVYASVLAAFIQWLAPRYADMRASASAQLATYREQLSKQLRGHKRTPEIAAHQLWAWSWFLSFATEAEAITEAERHVFWKRIHQAVVSAAKQQATYQKDEDPARRFVEIIQAALMAGKCHVATLDGLRPQNHESWGWRVGDAQGERVGWLEGDTLYLNPDAAYSVATKAGGSDTSTTATTLWKRLRQAGYLIVEEGQDSNLVRKTVDGRRIRVLTIPVAKMEADSNPTEGAQMSELVRGKAA